MDKQPNTNGPKPGANSPGGGGPEKPQAAAGAGPLFPIDRAIKANWSLFAECEGSRRAERRAPSLLGLREVERVPGLTVLEFAKALRRHGFVNLARCFGIRPKKGSRRERGGP
jgi:hypothetical protein